MMQSELLSKDNKLISKALKLRFHPITVKEAKGCTITDSNGKSYLDLTAGWAVANVGYGRESIAEKIHDQYLKLSFTTQLSAPSETMIQLAEKLVELTPGDFKESMVWSFRIGCE